MSRQKFVSTTYWCKTHDQDRDYCREHAIYYLGYRGDCHYFPATVVIPAAAKEWKDEPSV